MRGGIVWGGFMEKAEVEVTLKGSGIFFTQPYFQSVHRKTPARTAVHRKTLPNLWFQEQFSTPSPSDHISKGSWWKRLWEISHSPSENKLMAAVRQGKGPFLATCTDLVTDWVGEGSWLWLQITSPVTCGPVRFSCYEDMHFPGESEILTTSSVKGLLASSFTNHHHSS